MFFVFFFCVITLWLLKQLIIKLPPALSNMNLYCWSYSSVQKRPFAPLPIKMQLKGTNKKKRTSCDTKGFTLSWARVWCKRKQGDYSWVAKTVTRPAGGWRGEQEAGWRTSQLLTPTSSAHVATAGAAQVTPGASWEWWGTVSHLSVILNKVDPETKGHEAPRKLRI